MPARSMTYDEFLCWAKQRYQFCGGQLHGVSFPNGKIDWETQLGVYKLVPDTEKQHVELIQHRLGGQSLNIKSKGISWEEVGEQWTIEFNEEDITAEFMNKSTGESMKLKRFFDIHQKVLGLAFDCALW